MAVFLYSENALYWINTVSTHLDLISLFYPDLGNTSIWIPAFNIVLTYDAHVNRVQHYKK